MEPVYIKSVRFFFVLRLMIGTFLAKPPPLDLPVCDDVRLFIIWREEEGYTVGQGWRNPVETWDERTADVSQRAISICIILFRDSDLREDDGWGWW